MGAAESPGGLGRAARRAVRGFKNDPKKPADTAAFDAMTVPVTEVTLDGRLRPARVLADARLELLSRSNLDLLVASAEDAGLDYFLLPDRRPTQHAVAIVGSDARAFSDALRARAAGRPVYVEGSTSTAWIGDLADDESGTGLFGSDSFVRVWEMHASGPGGMRLGSGYAAHVELWERDDDGALVAPRRNELGWRLGPELQQATTARLTVSAGAEGAHGHVGAARDYRTLQPFTLRRIHEVDFPVDVVYTWVDGDDPAWRQRKNVRGAEFGLDALSPMAANASRYTNRDELRYSLRSIEMFAPWVRRIFLVTDQQRPDWLVDDHPRLQVVDHREIFDDPEASLPTFNSHAIESRLHHIDGLAEHYLYFNDDVMFGRAVEPELFFHSNGIWKYFLARAQVDLGAPDVEGKPITAAGKNNRAIIEELFERTLTLKMKHTPHAARRSVMHELEERVPAWFEATAAHPFRHPGDISAATSLGHYYAYCTGRAVPSEQITYDYADIAIHPVQEMFREWRSTRGLDVFCVNDTETSAEEHERLAPVVAGFFEKYFPLKSTFEK